MNGLELLKQDHRKVMELFRQVTMTRDTERRKELFNEIKDEIEVFTKAEEALVYPTLRRHEELQDIVHEAYEEHRQAKMLIRKIESLIADNEDFDTRLKMLGDNLERHFEEVENVMFTRGKTIFDSEQLELLGQDLEIAKGRFQQDFEKRSTANGRA